MDQQLIEMRDRLIAQFDGAVIFQSIIEGMIAEEKSALILTSGKDITIQAVEKTVADRVLTRETEALALAQEQHDTFIQQLRTEITDDPDERGYANMTDEEIAAEMMKERPVVEQRSGFSEMQGIINRVLENLAVRPTNIAIDAKGNILMDNFGPLQVLLDGEIQKAGDRDALAQPVLVSVQIGIKSAPCYRVSKGVKYGRNSIRVEEIVEARK